MVWTCVLFIFLELVDFIVLLFSFKRQTKMDWIRRCQIRTRPFLCPAQCYIFHNWNNSVRIGGTERRKRHEFDVGDIHGTGNGSLLFLVHGSCAISSFNILCLSECWPLFERGFNRGG